MVQAVEPAGDACNHVHAQMRAMHNPHKVLHFRAYVQSQLHRCSDVSETTAGEPRRAADHQSLFGMALRSFLVELGSSSFEVRHVSTQTLAVQTCNACVQSQLQRCSDVSETTAGEPRRAADHQSLFGMALRSFLVELGSSSFEVSSSLSVEGAALQGLRAEPAAALLGRVGDRCWRTTTGCRPPEPVWHGPAQLPGRAGQL